MVNSKVATAKAKAKTNMASRAMVKFNKVDTTRTEAMSKIIVANSMAVQHTAKVPMVNNKATANNNHNNHNNTTTSNSKVTDNKADMGRSLWKFPSFPFSNSPPRRQQGQAYGGPEGAPGGAQEGDRGLLGALGGAAAGGYGGHKAGHGILGAVGGAILGSLAEDYAKEKKHEHKGGSGGGSDLGDMASQFFSKK